MAAGPIQVETSARGSRIVQDSIVRGWWSARIAPALAWRWRGIGVYADHPKLPAADTRPVCLNADEVAATLRDDGPYLRVVTVLLSSHQKRWRGRYRIEIDARGRCIAAERHAYWFGFDELPRVQRFLKALRFKPARRGARACAYDCGLEVHLSLRKTPPA